MKPILTVSATMPGWMIRRGAWQKTPILPGFPLLPATPLLR